jgi:O-antigen biosynthesis protein
MSDELEDLRQQVARLEVENREIAQKLFDHYEWSRRMRKLLHEEIQSLRNISLEYQFLEFFKRHYIKTTGLPRKALLEDAGALKISLVIAPLKDTPEFEAWFRAILRQDHENFDLIVVLGRSFPELPVLAEAPEKAKIVRVSDELSEAERVRAGFGYRSGAICGFIRETDWLYPGSLKNVASFFLDNIAAQVMTPSALSVLDEFLVLANTPAETVFLDLWNFSFARFSGVFFRREAFEVIHGIDAEAGKAWEYATMLRFARSFNLKRCEATIFFSVGRDSDTTEIAEADSFDAVRTSFERIIWKPEWFRQRLRSLVKDWRTKLFSRRVPLWFPVAKLPDPRISRIDRNDLSVTVRCPITDEVVDRFLFSLALCPPSEAQIVDVYYSSRSSLAALRRRRVREPLPKMDVSVFGEASSRKSRWKFLIPAVAGSAVSRVSSSPIALPELDEVGFAASYAAIANSLLAHSNEPAGEALWLGDVRYWPESHAAGLPTYAEKHEWDALPGLAIVNFAQMQEWEFLKDRTEDLASRYSLIHLAGVLQYCSRPRYLLRVLASALQYGGLLLISTPNLDSEQLAIAGPGWSHWEPDRAQFIFGVQSLRDLLRHCGFEEKALLSFSYSPGTKVTGRAIASGKSLRQDLFLGLFSKIY